MLSRLSTSTLAVAFTLASQVMASPTRSHVIEARQQASVTPTAGQMSGNGKPYPSPGVNSPPQDSLPQEWIDKYNSAKNAGKIPDLPVTTLDNTTGLAEYPPGTDLSKTCNWSTQKCYNGDIDVAPPGQVGIAFDDGPYPISPTLAYYLSSNNIEASHFLIGSEIMYNPAAFINMSNTQPANSMHFGIHTFTHTPMTTKTDMELLGEFGWTSQIIYDVSGRIPMYWRPPQGDVDNRVRAVAKEVFGLLTVMWTEGNPSYPINSYDPNDWCLRDNNGTAAGIQTCQNVTYQGVVDQEKSWADQTPKTLGFIGLEHETTDQSTNAFHEYYAELQAKDWKTSNIPGLQNLPYYVNQEGPNDQPSKQSDILPTFEPINVEDPAAPAGSSGAPSTSEIPASTSAAASGSASNASSQSSNSQSSGASPSRTSAPGNHGDGNGALNSASTAGLVSILITAFSVAAVSLL